MKSKLIRPPGLTLKTGVMALFVITLAWLPQANASTAGAIIENVATVNWEDSSGGTYSDDAYTQVTVNLVTAAVTISGVPTGGSPGDTATAPVGQSVLSGSTATYYYAITSNANGSDVYNFPTPNTGADGHGRDPTGESNVTATPTVTWIEMTSDLSGTTGAADPGSVTLGSAIVAGVNSETQLAFPGGSLSDFSVGDIVVINGYDYAITALTAGTAPDYAVPTAEVQATMTLGASPLGYNTAPTFQSGAGGLAASVGNIVGEQKLFRVNVTATVNPATATGTVVHDIYLDNGTDVGQLQNTATTFNPLPSVTITKEVRNVTAGEAAFPGSGTGSPGDVLEYRVTITNSGSTAEAVIVRDPLPAYTNLVRYGTSYGVGAATNTDADFIAQAGDGGSTVDLTYGDGDDESATIASGDFGYSNAGEFTFYVGDNSVNASTATTGGDVPDSATFTVIYRVQIQPIVP